MKKIVALLLLLCICISLCACGSDSSEQPMGTTPSQDVAVWIITAFATSVDGVKFELNYDSNHNLMQMTALQEDNVFASEKYSFDVNGNLVTRFYGDDFEYSQRFIYDAYGNEIYDDVDYVYDANGKILKATYDDGRCFTYTYDNAGRLLSEDSDSGKTTYLYNSNGQLLEIRSDDEYGIDTVYTYANNGKIESETIYWGTFVEPEYAYTYKYDADDKISEAQLVYQGDTSDPVILYPKYELVYVPAEQVEAIEKQQAVIFDKIWFM